MKKQYTLPLGLVLCGQILFAQAPSIQWSKCFGGSGGDSYPYISKTTDGGFIMAARSDSHNGDVSGNHGKIDIWVAKTDSAGAIEWQKSYGGTKDDYMENGNTIEQTTDGGFIVAGSSFSNNDDVSGHHGSSSGEDIWVIKIDQNGNLQWQRSLGGISEDHGHAVRQTIDGGYLVGGTSYSHDGDVMSHIGGSDYWVVKLDQSGSLVWEKSFGGTSTEELNSLMLTDDGGAIISGVSTSSDGEVTNNHGSTDGWIVKLNAGGDLDWQHAYGGSNQEFISMAQQTPEGGYIMTGYSKSNDGDVSGNIPAGSLWGLKTDAEGNIEWSRCYYKDSTESGGASLQQLSDGDYVLAGATGSSSNNDYWIVKIDTAGNVKWETQKGGSGNDFLSGIEEAADHGVITTGYTFSNDGDVIGNHGSTDVWVVKLEACTAYISPSGNLQICKNVEVSLEANVGTGLSYQWQKNGHLIDGATNQTYTTTKGGSFNVIVTSASGCTDTSSATVIERLAAPQATITPIGSLDICTTGFVKLKADSGTGFSYQWYKKNHLIAGATNQVYQATVIGDYKVKVTNSNGCNKTSQKVTVYTTCKELITGDVHPVSIEIYPNPASGTLNVKMETSSDGELVITNLLGEIVFVQPFNSTELVVNVSSFASGVYVVKLATGQRTITQKFVKE